MNKKLTKKLIKEIKKWNKECLSTPIWELEKEKWFHGELLSLKSSEKEEEIEIGMTVVNRQSYVPHHYCGFYKLNVLENISNYLVDNHDIKTLEDLISVLTYNYTELNYNLEHLEYNKKTREWDIMYSEEEYAKAKKVDKIPDLVIKRFI